MAKTNYSDKLKDPRWQKMRLLVLNRDSWACVYCGDKESTLHVHHACYIGTDPWDTPECCLRTLCEYCHTIEHLDLTELERFLIDALRNHHLQQHEYHQMLNNVIRNMKNKVNG